MLDEMTTRMLVLCVFICDSMRIRGVLDVRPIGYECQGQCVPLSNYHWAIENVLRRVETETHVHGYDYLTHEVFRGSKCFAHAICDRALSAQSCIDCLRIAETEVFSRCSFPIRATMILKQCLLKFQEVVI